MEPLRDPQRKEVTHTDCASGGRLARAGPSNSRCQGMFVDVFFLRIMQPDQRFEGFDDPLRIADQIMVDVVLREAAPKAGQKRREVLNFTMGAAHSGEAGQVGKPCRELRKERSLIHALMFHHGFLHERIGFADQRESVCRVCIIEGVSDFAKPVEGPFQGAVVMAESIG